MYPGIKPRWKVGDTTDLKRAREGIYSIFEETLSQCGRGHLAKNLQKHQAHRGTVNSISQLFADNGFNIRRYFEESFKMKFLDGSAFLNHHFVKLGWLTSWMELIPKDEWTEVFLLLEQNLNRYAAQTGSLTLTVPMAYLEGEKK